MKNWHSIELGFVKGDFAFFLLGCFVYFLLGCFVVSGGGGGVFILPIIVCSVSHM